MELFGTNRDECKIRDTVFSVFDRARLLSRTRLRSNRFVRIVLLSRLPPTPPPSPPPSSPFPSRPLSRSRFIKVPQFGSKRSFLPLPSSLSPYSVDHPLYLTSDA